MSDRTRTRGARGGARPGAVAEGPPPVTPGNAKLLARGLTRRCPVCGQRGLTRRWIELATECPGCGFRFERSPGHFVGAVGMNTIATFGLLLVVLVAGFVLTWPDVPYVGLALAGLGVAVVVPPLLHATTKTLWAAIDLMMNPLEAGEIRDPGRVEVADLGTGSPEERPT